MSMKSEMPPELIRVSDAWAERLEGLTDPHRIAFMQKALIQFLANQDFFRKLLQNIATGAPYPDTRRTTLFPNEIVLYLHDRRSLSLRMLLSETGSYTPIHDHNAWGVITPMVGELDIIGYERLNPRSGNQFSGLRQTLHKTLYPGETAQVLPLEKGIHQTGNSGQGPLVMISVYGKPVRRPYVLGYDLDRNRVYRIYTPRTRKRMLAKEALEHLSTNPAPANR